MLYATPSPQRKKEPSTGPNKLRLFLKRSSEPLLNLQNAVEKVFSITFDYTIAFPSSYISNQNPDKLHKCRILRNREDIHNN